MSSSTRHLPPRSGAISEPLSPRKTGEVWRFVGVLGVWGFRGFRGLGVQGFRV